MSQYILNLKQKYHNELVELIFTLSPSFTKKEFNRFQDHFSKKASKLEISFGDKKRLTTIELKKYQKAIDRFIYNRRKFAEMLEETEISYRKIPFLKMIKNSTQDLKEKEKLLKEYLEEYDDKKELEKLEEFTYLTEEERIGLAKNLKDTILRQQSKTQKAIEKSLDPTETHNETLKKEFIDIQWKRYQRFFDVNPVFHKILSSILSEFLEDYFRDQKVLDVKSHLISIIIIRKYVIKKLKEKEKEFKKELLERLKNSKYRSDSTSQDEVMPKKISFLNFFAYILTQSDLKLRFENSEIIISFDIKTLYKNFFDLLSKYSNVVFSFQEGFIIDENHFLLTDFKRNLLKKINSELKRFNENILIYEEIEEKTGVKFNFKQIIEPFLEDFTLEHPAKIPKQRPSKHTIIERYHLKTVMLSLGIIIICIVGLSIFSAPDKTQFIAQKHDSVQIDYTVWVSNKSKEYDVLNPILDITLWIRMIPITENDTTGIMLGLYNNLLGKELYYESELKWLDKCIDQNRDGIDDITNKTALTYGNSTDQYFNTALMIRFKILDIEKAPDYQESPFNREKVFGFLSYIFQMVWIITLPILLMLIPIFITLIIDFISRHPIDFRKINIRGIDLRKTFSLFIKYGILIGILVSIPYIVFGIIKLQYSPALLKIIWMENPEEIIVLIATFSIPSIIVTAIIYLLLYKKVK